MSPFDPRRRSRGARWVTLGLSLGLFPVQTGSGAGAKPRANETGGVQIGAPHALAQGRRDPLGIVRTSIRPRVWMLLDTSDSMDSAMGDETRFAGALRVIRWAAANLETASGEPLVHWRLATFERFHHTEGSSRRAVCADRTMGAGLPGGSPPGPPRSSVRCGGLRLLSEVSGCDAEAGRSRLLRSLPSGVNTDRTPLGIALYQLATHVAGKAAHDLEPGGRDVIVVITDGVDSCECVFHPWLDFNDGPSGKGDPGPVWLRTGQATSEPRRYRATLPSRSVWNAGLKAKAAFLALNRGDPDAGLGDIHVVGVAMTDEASRGFTNHLAWMASGGRRPAIYADRPETFQTAIGQVLNEITLPSGEVRLAAPRLATVKELVATSPSPVFPGSDPSLPPDALVAPASAANGLEEVLRRRAAYPDNILLSTYAELPSHRGGLRALPTSPAGGGSLNTTPVWDAGSRLADRDPADRLVLFHRPGSRELRPFRVGEVTARDLGVGAGYLRELDGTGALTAEDAAKIVVRLVRGEQLEIHPDTGTMYRPDGGIHFTGGRGTWKLREGLASPVAVPNPPRLPGRMSRERESYGRFFARHLNRRTMVYLPTSGGLLHAFAADSGEEVFAFVPDDVLGPASPAEDTAERFFLRDLVLAGIPEAAGLRRGLVNRFALAGSPVVRDVFLPGIREWRTVLAFGRSFGGRFVTALDVTGVGDDWAGTHEPPRPSPGGSGVPRLLFNVGRRSGGPGASLEELGETPEPLMVEVAAIGGSEWTMFLPAGVGEAHDGSGEWLLTMSPMDGQVLGRYRLPRVPAARIPKNSAATSAVPWTPAWAVSGATDLVTRVYVGDLHGQIHRLQPSEPDARRWSVVHRLGGEHPILTSPVAFPFPGRPEPHLLIVTGGDRRVQDTPSAVVVLRDEGSHLAEVWRTTLAGGETPQGKPVVLADRSGVEVLLATHTAETRALSCDVATTTDGAARLRAFDGMTGEALAGPVDAASPTLSLGRGRIRGLSLSSAGNLALSVSGADRQAVDMVIGDFEFRVRDGALEDVTLFVEGFRRSPFWTR